MGVVADDVVVAMLVAVLLLLMVVVVVFFAIAPRTWARVLVPVVDSSGSERCYGLAS